VVRRVLEADPKVSSRYRIQVSQERGKVEGIDVSLHPKSDRCSVNPDSSECRPVELEVKSVEKLFEHDESVGWPHNRVSRYVLKQSETPDCYVFVTRDDISSHTVVDFVDATHVGRWMRRLTKGAKSPKLPVRALPLLRRHPCKYVHKPIVVIPEKP
jgi:hypothetical protein